MEEKVTKEEAVQFATELEANATKRKEGFLSSNIILSSLLNRFDQVKKIKDWNEVEKSVGTTLKKNELDKNLLQMMGNNGSFEKVKIYEKNGNQRVVFRGFGDGGFNYLDMELVKFDKKVGIADIYVYFTGENFSTTMAELMDKLLNISPSSDEYVAQRLTSIRNLVKQGKFSEARTQFNYLPGSVRATTAGVTLNVQILSQLDDDASLQELSTLEKRYNSQPYFQLQMMDVYTNRKEYDKAISAINALDSTIDKDPFLDYYRGLFAYLKGDKETAMNYYEKVTISNPNFPGAFAELFALYALQDNKEKAKNYFAAYRKLRNKDPEVVKRFIAVYPYLDDKNTQQPTN